MCDERTADRRRLAAVQAQLVRSLLRHEAPPDRFDASRVAQAGLALQRKRRRSIARAWPQLITALGERWPVLIDAYAEQAPVLDDESLEDGRRFVEFLRHHGDVDDTARIEAMEVLLRTGPRIGWIRLRDRRRILLMFRIGRRISRLRWPIGN
jgi:hypothetical protein